MGTGEQVVGVMGRWQDTQWESRKQRDEEHAGDVRLQGRLEVVAEVWKIGEGCICLEGCSRKGASVLGEKARRMAGTSQRR